MRKVRQDSASPKAPTRKPPTFTAPLQHKGFFAPAPLQQHGHPGIVQEPPELKPSISSGSLDSITKTLRSAETKPTRMADHRYGSHRSPDPPLGFYEFAPYGWVWRLPFGARSAPKRSN